MDRSGVARRGRPGLGLDRRGVVRPGPMTLYRRMFPLASLSATVVRSDRQPVAPPVDDSIDEPGDGHEVPVRHKEKD